MAAAATSGGGSAGTAAQEPAAAPTAASSIDQTYHTWEWRGYRVHYTVAGSGPPVLLVHGFGASARHYRNNIPALAAAGYQVRVHSSLSLLMVMTAHQ